MCGWREKGILKEWKTFIISIRLDGSKCENGSPFLSLTAFVPSLDGYHCADVPVWNRMVGLLKCRALCTKQSLMSLPRQDEISKSIVNLIGYIYLRPFYNTTYFQFYLTSRCRAFFRNVSTLVCRFGLVTTFKLFLLLQNFWFFSLMGRTFVDTCITIQHSLKVIFLILGSGKEEKLALNTSELASLVFLLRTL